MNDIALNNSGYRVRTPSGYRDFVGVAYMGDKPVFRIDFGDGKFLETTGNHKLFDSDANQVLTENLRSGDSVLAKDGTLVVIQVHDTGRVEPVYDLIDVDGGHVYYTDGVLSHNCEFINDDETLIEAMCLARLVSIKPEFFTGQIRWFQEPQPNKTYLVALDPSLGTGGDFSAIEVFELPGMIQVAEWQNNSTPPRTQVKTLLYILTMLDSELRDHPDQDGEPILYWTVENNTIGETILMVIEDTGEHNFPGTFISEKKRVGNGRRRKGLNTDNRKKLNACAKLKSLVESDRLKVNSQPLLKQLKTFVSRGASFAAKSGEKDDLVMATVLCVRMLETVANWLSSEEAEELNESIDLQDDDDDQPLPIFMS